MTAVIASIAAVSSGLLAETYYVSSSGNNTPPYDTWEKASHTIQTAIDLCAGSDTVLVGPGTYSPSSGEEFPIQIMGSYGDGVELAIVGFNGASETVVDAQRTGDVIRGDYTSISLEGLTITGGSGGGVSVFTGGVLSIVNCRIIHNQGAAVRRELWGGVKISGSIVSGNGSGVYAEHNVTMDSCLVSSNGYFGVEASEATVRYSELTGNGGCGVGGRDLVLIGINSSHNQREGVGCGDGSVYMERCVVAGNAEEGVKLVETHHATILDCTICENTGSGIYCLLGSIQVSRSIVYKNGGFGGDFGMYCSATLTCCDIFGNKDGDWVGCIASQYETNGNFSSDPLFCGSDNGDYRLSRNSPCVNFSRWGQIGALGVGCSPPAVEATTWGRIKSLYR